MHAKIGLFQQQTLKLAMTQELSQAIALLQYSSQELSSFLDERATENPLITIESREAVFDGRKGTNKQIGTQTNKGNWIEQIGYVNDTLEDHLLSQLPPDYFGSRERKQFLHLVNCLDENGYLRAPLEVIAAQTNSSMESLQEIFHTLQSLEPAGVGARNLQECLHLQLVRKDEPLALEIIDHHFAAFADKKWKPIAKELGVSLSAIQEVFDLVQSLHPRPGALFDQEKPAYIAPDVIVEIKDSQISVKMADDHLSSITFNQQYYQQMSSIHDQQVNRFMQDKFHEFQWIQKSIQQRKETILKVMGIIAEKQVECLEKGFAYLKPMAMKEVADELDVHESTVSRAVRDKYVRVPFGTVEMREFFTAGLQSLSTSDVSSREAKNAIQSLVQEEDKKRPLSDQDIADRLRSQNKIILSRRTVAKYREQLKIPSSSKRKRF
ncbi:RNA polymerase factor sigma-54 [Bacillus testis]|uniref:RNA polymerase factor sigma-54 n=1 Tax=Bacillus testis TaxID=1622072 RepID=UPI00067F51AA|nr:RNA polymerase factor sigma-54 [Bacillus testis]